MNSYMNQIFINAHSIQISKCTFLSPFNDLIVSLEQSAPFLKIPLIGLSFRDLHDSKRNSLLMLMISNILS